MGTTLQAWIDSHPVGQQMFWRGSTHGQFEVLRRLEHCAKDYDPNSTLEVVSSHTSKSITLPVVKITVPSIGMTIYARDNFSNWAVSIDSQKEVRHFSTTGMDSSHLRLCYFEGFERGGAGCVWKLC